MDIRRSIKYRYLQLRRLKGEPEQLAMGIAVGVFVGCLPIIPFQTVVAVTLAFCFKSSKITAAIGTWVSNPLDWYFLYYYSYKIGAVVLGLPEHRELFASIVSTMHETHSFIKVAEAILQTGSLFSFAFVIGGALIGMIASPISYFVFLFFFKKAKKTRENRKSRMGLQQIP